jgi:hypothetical protein
MRVAFVEFDPTNPNLAVTESFWRWVLPPAQLVHNIRSVAKTLPFAGVKNGCFIADHQPPNKIVDILGARKKRFWQLKHRVIPQRFYPQCRSCSQLQGKALAHTVKRVLVTHRLLFRRPQLMLIGLALAFNAARPCPKRISDEFN